MHRTELSVSPSELKIDHTQQCVSLGSCFAVMIGEKLSRFKFNCLSNPQGILYNPASLHRVVDWALSGTTPAADRTTALHGRYVHHDFHSEISGETVQELMDTIAQHLQGLGNALKQADWLILTYGTAMMHSLDGTPVANCHKRPAKDFGHAIASYDSLLSISSDSLSALKQHNPDIQVILTVSPVRHVNDTLPVNALSKSKLRMLCDDLANRHTNVNYFPSYEIMMDDLRDYRYYKRDLIHPTEEAEDYIWQLFGDSYFSERTRQLNEKWGKILRNLSHRPFNPASRDHHDFLQQTLDQLEAVAEKLPVDREINQVKSLLQDA